MSSIPGALRKFAVGALVVAAVLVLVGAPFSAAAQARGEARAGSSQMLRQLYLNGQARMAKGDAAGALLPFEVTSEVAPELPQTHYAVGVALLIADFAHRERALAALGRALDAEPGNPLFQIAAVIADERRSLLRADGALYLTAEAAATLDAATARLREEKAALNGRYLAALLGEREATGDPAHPERLAGFAGMVGSQGRVRLPEWREAQPLGRLLALAIPDAQFASYEPRMVARLQNGLDSLSPENQRHLRVKARLEAVRGHFRPEPGPRS